jgi:ribosomal protein L37E
MKNYHVKLRVCACCGDSKKARAFTFSSKFGYAKHCRECGQWLYLLRRVFGDTRDWAANREKTRLRALDKNRKPATNLWNAWVHGTV